MQTIWKEVFFTFVVLINFVLSQRLGFNKREPFVLKYDKETQRYFKTLDANFISNSRGYDFKFVAENGQDIITTCLAQECSSWDPQSYQDEISHLTQRLSLSSSSTNPNPFNLLKIKFSTSGELYMSQRFCTNEISPSLIRDHDSDTPNCNIYKMIYEVDFGTAVYYENKNQPEKIAKFEIATYCFKPDTKDTLWAEYTISNFRTLNNMNNVKTINSYAHDVPPYIYDEFNIQEVYEMTNQIDTFQNLVGNHYLSLVSDSDRILEQELIDQKTLLSMSWKQAALHYVNIAPMYLSVHKSWKAVEKAIVKAFDDDYNVKIVTGTYGTLIFNDTEIYLAYDKVRVPQAFFKVLNLIYTNSTETYYFSIAFITHNSMWVKNEYICDTPISCEFNGFDVTQTESFYGLTYCCALTNTLQEKFGIQIYTTHILNLHDLSRVVNDEDLD